MARVHLANGHDVIMPQMMTNVNAGELACVESAAAATNAEYCQILLTALVESAVGRCMERVKGGDPRQDVISKVIDWDRLMVNVGIVLVFAAFYFRFLKRP